jgi:hypothetical protein
MAIRKSRELGRPGPGLRGQEEEEGEKVWGNPATASLPLTTEEKIWNRFLEGLERQGVEVSPDRPGPWVISTPRAPFPGPAVQEELLPGGSKPAPRGQGEGRPGPLSEYRWPFELKPSAPRPGEGLPSGWSLWDDPKTGRRFLVDPGRGRAVEVGGRERPDDGARREQEVGPVFWQEPESGRRWVRTPSGWQEHLTPEEREERELRTWQRQLLGQMLLRWSENPDFYRVPWSLATTGRTPAATELTRAVLPEVAVGQALPMPGPAAAPRSPRAGVPSAQFWAGLGPRARQELLGLASFYGLAPEEFVERVRRLTPQAGGFPLRWAR